MAFGNVLSRSATWTWGLLAIAGACLALLSATPLRANEQAISFDSPRAALAWINAYRDDPQPKTVPAAIKSMSRLGLFRDLERAGVYLGFFAGVLSDNQLKAHDLIAQTFPLRPEDQVVIIRGIADSGLPDWKATLGAFTERMPARQILIRSYLFGKAKPLRQLKLDKGPAVLDAHWGVYFATGRYDPILSILTALAWVDEDADLERLTIASMAAWTLANNASRDKYLLDFLRAETYRQPKTISAALRRIVTAAETFEVAALRKEAVAKIDKLKAKGPPRKRGWAWWSEIAGTVVAVGCVAAGATGQVALGLPCIIGGTLSSAATRYLRLEEQRKAPTR
ncbi:MAG: hypothetical protein AAFR23_09190 [Pseudomonadota bacterium]